jgi:hypothetical protein
VRSVRHTDQLSGVTGLELLCKMAFLSAVTRAAASRALVPRSMIELASSRPLPVEANDGVVPVDKPALAIALASRWCHSSPESRRAAFPNVVAVTAEAKGTSR